MTTALTDELKNKVSVLVVDDIPSARKIVVRILAKIGFQNIVQCDGVKDSLEQIASKDFDLMISDIHLKDGKGTDIIKLLEDKTKLQSLRCIFVTSDLERKNFLDSVDCRAIEYLLKPFSPANLEDKITQLMSL